jgi:hypothetical protein
MSPQNPAIDPRRTALLIMDYQPAVLGGLSDHDQLLTLASGAIDLARQALPQLDESEDDDERP